MKKLTLLLIPLLLLALLIPAGAAEKPDIAQFELPKPAAPHYMRYDAADRTATEGDDALYVVRQSDLSVVTLAAEEASDRDAFLAKYGLYDFRILMQYDTSLDDTAHWNYTPEWDTDYGAVSPYEAGAVAWISGDLMDIETIFDLYHRSPDNDTYNNMKAAILHRHVPYGDYAFDNYYFDHENHTLNIRCRYYMEWETYDGQTVGEKQTRVSEWSDVASFGKNGTAITPAEPTGYAAPIIADLRYVQPTEGSELGELTYTLTTPASVWEAGIYYVLTESGSFDTLETQISLNGGDWQEFFTVDSWGIWGIRAGQRTAWNDEPRIEADHDIKLRVRYVGTHGESPWSNVLSLKDGGTQEVTDAPGGSGTNGRPTDTPDGACGICGFCPIPLGLCIFIWLAIIVLVIVILVVVLLICTREKKCKTCGAPLDRRATHCPNCGRPKNQ